MLKVRFRVLSASGCLAMLSTRSECFEFDFNDAGSEPFSELVNSLVAVHSSLEVETKVGFYEEPGFVFLKFSKTLSEQVTLTVCRDNGPPEWTYAGDCEEIILSFWRGLRLLQEDLLYGKGFWSNSDPLEDLEKLKSLIKS